jgi:membrane-associated phospholipid phosphatase
MQNFLHNMEWVVALRSDLLTPVFKAFSALGYGEFLLLFVPIGYWIFNKNIFARVGLWLLLSVLLNAYLKYLLQDPRPDPVFNLDPAVGQSYGFPSRHAQVAIVIWFWIAWEARKTWIWILSSILVVGICFSRLYLGVHDVEDVLGGIGIGLLSLLVFIFLTTKRFQWWHNLHFSWQMAGIAIIEAFLFFIWPGKPSISAIVNGVLLLGYWLGVGIERRWIFFQKNRNWWRIIVSALIGVVILIVLRKGIQIVTATLEFERITVASIQAFISGVYMTALAPWIFQRLRLADKGNLVGD